MEREDAFQEKRILVGIKKIRDARGSFRPELGKNDSLADHVATNQGGFVCLQPAERTSFSKTRLIRFGLHHFALSQSDLLQLALLFNCLYSVPAMDIVILF